MKPSINLRLTSTRRSRKLIAWESLEDRRLLTVAVAPAIHLASPDFTVEMGPEHGRGFHRHLKSWQTTRLSFEPHRPVLLTALGDESEHKDDLVLTSRVIPSDMIAFLPSPMVHYLKETEEVDETDAVNELAEHVFSDSQHTEEETPEWRIDQAIEGMIAMDAAADRVMEVAPGVVLEDTALADIEVEVEAAMGCAMVLEIIESPVNVRSKPLSPGPAPAEESERAVSPQQLTPMEAAVVTISTLALSCSGPRVLKNAGHRLDHQESGTHPCCRKKDDH